MKLVSLVVVMVAGVASGCASTSPAEAPAATSAQVASADGAEVNPIPPPVEEKDPIVCKSVVPTGSRIASKSCMRKSERDAIRRSSQEGTDAAQRSGAQTGNGTRG